MNNTYQLTNGSSILRSDGACIPADPANSDYAAYLAWLGEGNVPDPAETVDTDPIANYINALTDLFDKAAQSRKYDSLITCALRAGYPGPFQAEGQAFAMWMDACNKQGYDTLAAVKSGAAVKPSVDDFIAALPKLTWPT